LSARDIDVGSDHPQQQDKTPVFVLLF